MANPLLTTWDAEGDLRTFELVGDSFVLLGIRSGLLHDPSSAGLTAGAQEYPVLSWYYDDDHVLVARTISAEVTGVLRVDRFGGDVGSELQYDSITIANSGEFIGIPIYPGAILNRNVIGDGSLRAYTYLSNLGFGQPSQQSAGTGVSTGTGPVSLAVSDDLAMVIVGLANNARWALRTNNILPPTYNTTSVAVTFDITPDLLVFDKAVRAGSDKGIVLADKALQRAMSYAFTGGAWEASQDIPLPVGTPHQIAMSPDQRLCAISVVNGGVYTTRILKRIATYYAMKQDITGFGEILAFSADGGLLADIGLRKLYRKAADDSFSEIAGAMSGIPADQMTGVFSTALEGSIPLTRTYNGALPAFVTGTVDLEGLKFTFLKSTATFDPTDETYEDVVTGGHEADGGLWPAGGVPMENIAVVQTDTTVALTTDDITRTIVGSTGLTARYGLIYDSTNNDPLVWVDFREDRIVASNRELVISFPDGEFLRYEN